MAENSGSNPSAHHEHNIPNIINEQDRLLPIANVGRIMKQILPPNAKIAKEGKETMQECASEFISFVTGEASERCKRERRKILNGDDICWAMGTLGFDDYAEPLKRYLHRYRELEGDNNSRGNYSQEKALGMDDHEVDLEYLASAGRYKGEASNP